MGVHLQAAPTFWQCIECVPSSTQLANSQDIKVLTIYCSIIGNPISGQDTPVLQDIWVFM